MALESCSTKEVVDYVFSGSSAQEKQEIVQTLHLAGVQFGRDVSRLDDREEARKLLGRPLPSSISKPLVDHKLLHRSSATPDLCVGMHYLDNKEDKQSKLTGHLIKKMFKRVNVSKYVEAFVPLIDGVDRPFGYPDESFLAYNAMVEEMKQGLGAAVTFDRVEAEPLREPYWENESALFRFYSQGKLLWMMRSCAENETDMHGVGGLMFDMDQLFSDEPERCFAFGVVLIRDYIWVFRFIPENFEPVACLYVLLREDGLEMLTKIMCAPPELLGVL